MINFTAITTAVFDLLNEANTSNKNYVIVRNAVVNKDENKAFQGWIGIYRDSVSYEPYQSGPTPFLATVKITIEAQAASMASEHDCEAKLDELVDFIMGAIDDGDRTKRTLKGTVLGLTGYEVEYDDSFSENTSTFFQFATITATYEVKA